MSASVEPFIVFRSDVRMSASRASPPNLRVWFPAVLVKFGATWNTFSSCAIGQLHALTARDEPSGCNQCGA